MNDSSLTDLDLRLQPLAQQFLDLCNQKFTTKITITWRSAQDQNLAASAGLSKATAGHSPHNCCDVSSNPASKAFDFEIIDTNGNYISNGEDPLYTQAGEIAESIGLFWGGRWTKEKDHCNPDYDHVQMQNWKSI